MSWHAQPPQIAGPVDVALLECRRTHLEESGKTRDIVLGQIDEALLFTAFRTAGLALEAHGLSRFDQVYSDNARRHNRTNRTRDGLLHALSARRAEARFSHWRTRGADLPDDVVRL